MAAHPVVDRKQIANELDGVVCETYEMAGDRSMLEMPVKIGDSLVENKIGDS